MDEVVKWQKRLQTIEAVVSLWLEVQDKWTELEEVSELTTKFRHHVIALVYFSIINDMLYT